MDPTCPAYTEVEGQTTIITPCATILTPVVDAESTTIVTPVVTPIYPQIVNPDCVPVLTPVVATGLNSMITPVVGEMHHPMATHVAVPGSTAVFIQGGGVALHPSARHVDSMEEDRDDDGYIIDDDYYYFDNGYYHDSDYRNKDHYWKFFKTPAGEKFKYSRK